MALQRSRSLSTLVDPVFDPDVSAERGVLTEEAFRRTIAIERKRTERSMEPFLLMLLDAGHHHGSMKNGRALDGIVAPLLTSTRDTDAIGWYKDRTTIGVIFTGLATDDKKSILSAILTRMSTTLRDNLTLEQFNQVNISFHLFPDDWDHDSSGRPSNPTLYPDLPSDDNSREPVLSVKRLMDIAGSALALIMCAPIMLVIALAVRFTSKGPILFKQQRVGRYGACFTFFKFRSMRADNDPSAHREFVAKLIAGHAESEAPDRGGEQVYKLTNDKRITAIGKVLRKTSLDELPQLLNVLKGEMSLVGPRPAIPYEVSAYKTWHRRRVLEVKPGITGLWQVNGRSRVKFDEMVRLDLRYARSWSPWLDMKILMRTPRAVIMGVGAH